MTVTTKGKLIVHNVEMQDYDEIVIMDIEEKTTYQRYVRVR